MPVITMESGPLSNEQKDQLIIAFTEIASDIMDMAESEYLVFLREMDRDNIGIGGIAASKRKR